MTRQPASGCCFWRVAVESASFSLHLRRRRRPRPLLLLRCSKSPEEPLFFFGRPCMLFTIVQERTGQRPSHVILLGNSSSHRTFSSEEQVTLLSLQLQLEPEPSSCTSHITGSSEISLCRRRAIIKTEIQPDLFQCSGTHVLSSGKPRRLCLDS